MNLKPNGQALPVMKTTPIADFRLPVLAFLNGPSAAAISEAAVDEAVRTVVVLQLHGKCKLTDDRTAISPELAPESETYTLLIKRTLLLLQRHLRKDQVVDIRNEIYQIENGEQCG